MTVTPQVLRQVSGHVADLDLVVEIWAALFVATASGGSAQNRRLAIRVLARVVRHLAKAEQLLPRTAVARELAEKVECEVRRQQTRKGVHDGPTSDRRPLRAKAR